MLLVKRARGKQKPKTKPKLSRSQRSPPANAGAAAAGSYFNTLTAGIGAPPPSSSLFLRPGPSVASACLASPLRETESNGINVHKTRPLEEHEIQMREPKKQKEIMDSETGDDGDDGEEGPPRKGLRGEDRQEKERSKNREAGNEDDEEDDVNEEDDDVEDRPRRQKKRLTRDRPPPHVDNQQRDAQLTASKTRKHSRDQDNVKEEQGEEVETRPPPSQITQKSKNRAQVFLRHDRNLPECDRCKKSATPGPCYTPPDTRTCTFCKSRKQGCFRNGKPQRIRHRKVKAASPAPPTRPSTRAAHSDTPPHRGPVSGGSAPSNPPSFAVQPSSYLLDKVKDNMGNLGTIFTALVNENQAMGNRLASLEREVLQLRRSSNKRTKKLVERLANLEKMTDDDDDEEDDDDDDDDDDDEGLWYMPHTKK
ncbi:hypothetical protein BDN70DRAFT_991333 [Pholiota conissans]|uniref:Uncharacterized protein n=1 Tax=Pholiota conissans TaxID=109636 RepID=A0A9P5Z8P7_9AGAR|nr:hypothetical protein BDN70DRAFT_991333 [Pholiota conissans]